MAAPSLNSTQIPSINAPLRFSGLEAYTLPLTPLFEGIVNISSVGIFGLNTTPFDVTSDPPCQKWFGTKSTFKLVPKEFLKWSDLKLYLFIFSERSCINLTWFFQYSIGSESAFT